MRFIDINLRPEIHQALADIGYQDLSPIQEQTFLPIIERRDIVALAQTGSGKTGACGVPLAQLIDEELKAVQVLVLVPTRELALQYHSELCTITRYTGITPIIAYGGVPIDAQLKSIREGGQILVATPGRLIDILHTGVLNFRSIEALVLDEADEMLTMGFLEDVEFIMSCIVCPHQTLLFSATMPSDLANIIAKFLKDPLRIQLNLDSIAPDSLEHHFHYVNSQAEREDHLFAFLGNRQLFRQVLVFCNSRFKGEHLYKRMRKVIRHSEYLHGGMDQNVRSVLFNEFKRGELPVLLATDVAGRGLDFSNVSHVINFDFPRSEVDYTHRTGRAGRMGRKGVALSYVLDEDIRTLQRTLSLNRIEPLWIGTPPDLTASRPKKSRHSFRPHR